MQVPADGWGDLERAEEGEEDSEEDVEAADDEGGHRDDGTELSETGRYPWTHAYTLTYISLIYVSDLVATLCILLLFQLKGNTHVLISEKNTLRKVKTENTFWL